jgi:hypothetical protein
LRRTVHRHQGGSRHEVSASAAFSSQSRGGAGARREHVWLSWRLNESDTTTDSHFDPPKSRTIRFAEVISPRDRAVKRLACVRPPRRNRRRLWERPITHHPNTGSR